MRQLDLILLYYGKHHRFEVLKYKIKIECLHMVYKVHLLLVLHIKSHPDVNQMVR